MWGISCRIGRGDRRGMGSRIMSSLVHTFVPERGQRLKDMANTRLPVDGRDLCRHPHCLPAQRPGLRQPLACGIHRPGQPPSSVRGIQKKGTGWNSPIRSSGITAINKSGAQDASTGGDVHTRNPKDLAIPYRYLIPLTFNYKLNGLPLVKFIMQGRQNPGCINNRRDDQDFFP